MSKERKLRISQVGRQIPEHLPKDEDGIYNEHGERMSPDSPEMRALREMILANPDAVQIHPDAEASMKEAGLTKDDFVAMVLEQLKGTH